MRARVTIDNPIRTSGFGATSSPSRSQQSAPWFKNLICATCGEECSTCQRSGGKNSIAKYPSKYGPASPVQDSMTQPPTAALHDAKAIRELSELRQSFTTAELDFEEPYTGPVMQMALNAMLRVHTLMHDPSLNKFCDVHLRMNELHFESYMLTQGREEESDTRKDNSDFYMVAKARP